MSLATFDPPGTRCYFDGDAPYFPIGQGRDLPLPLRWLNYFASARRLAALKRRLNIDLTISVLWRADLINVLSSIGERKFSLGVINILNNSTNALMQHFRGFVGRIYRRFDCVFAIGPGVAEELQTLYRLDPRKIKVFRNFIAANAVEPVWPAHEKVRFVFCGRFVHEKNIDGLLHLWADFARARPGRQLVLIGDGPLLDDMKSLAVEHGLSVDHDPGAMAADVLFVGTTQQPESFMAGARAFVLTSRHEGVPTVLILAAALGLPIMAADCHGGGVRHLLGLPPQALLPQCVSAGMVLPVPEPANPDSLVHWAERLLAVRRRCRTARTLANWCLDAGGAT